MNYARTRTYSVPWTGLAGWQTFLQVNRLLIIISIPVFVLLKAVCCSDNTHCCPSGYTCSQGSCTRGALTIPWVTKNVAQPVQVKIKPVSKSTSISKFAFQELRTDLAPSAAHPCSNTKKLGHITKYMPMCTSPMNKHRKAWPRMASVVMEMIIIEILSCYFRLRTFSAMVVQRNAQIIILAASCPVVSGVAALYQMWVLLEFIHVNPGLPR